MDEVPFPPNASANLANPTSLTVISDKGHVVASWPAVSGASGYSVSIGNFNDIPYWSHIIVGTSHRFKETYPGGRLTHGETYQVTVKPFFQGTGVPRAFPRPPGRSTSVVLDALVNPPASATAVGRADRTISITITKSQDTDIKGHNIYRMNEGGLNRRLLTATPITTLTYTDAAASLWQDYQYEVTAVDTRNNESLPVTTGIVHAGPQAGSGFTISYRGAKRSIVDGEGNMFMVRDFSATAPTGLIFKKTSSTTGAGITTDGWLRGTSLSIFQSTFLGNPANVAGGLLLRKSGTPSLVHFSSNGKITLAKDFFENTR